MMATVYARTTGAREHHDEGVRRGTRTDRKRENPKTDIWFGGTGDLHLQAAEQGLTLEYKSPSLPQLHDWAQQQARQSGYRTVGIYRARSASATTPSCWPSKKLAVRQDLGGPGETGIQGGGAGGQPRFQRHRVHHDRDAGAADGRGQGLRLSHGLHRNVSTYPRSGTAPIKAVARGRRRSPSASCTTARARRCRASRWRPSRRPTAPGRRSAP